MAVVLGCLALAGYLAAAVVLRYRFRNGSQNWSFPGIGLFAAGVVIHLAVVVIQGVSAGHLPFTSRFEVLLVYSFSYALTTGAVQLSRRELPVAVGNLPLICIVLVLTLLVSDKQPKPLPAILASPYFLLHVVTAFAGYSLYSVNFGLALGALLSAASAELLQLARQIVLWGLLLLGAGIALGSIWALHAWGNWWSWDPKEIGAFATWLAYWVFIHAPAWRRSPRRSDTAYLIVAYLLLLFTFFGVNLLKKGLHVYL